MVDTWLIAVVVLAAVILVIVTVLVGCVTYNRSKTAQSTYENKYGDMTPIRERANWQMRTGHGTHPPAMLRASPLISQPVYAEYTLEGELFELQSTRSATSNTSTAGYSTEQPITLVHLSSSNTSWDSTLYLEKNNVMKRNVSKFADMKTLEYHLVVFEYYDCCWHFIIWNLLDSVLRKKNTLVFKNKHLWNLNLSRNISSKLSCEFFFYNRCS